MDPYIKTTLTALFLLVAGWVLKTVTDSFLKRSEKKEKSASEILDRLGEIETRLKVLDIQVSPFWGAVQNEMLKTLHHDPKDGSEFAEADALIDKFVDEAVETTPADKERLKELMIIRSTDPNPNVGEIERSTAKIIALVMDKATEEKEEPDKATTPKLVAMPDAEAGEAAQPEADGKAE